VANQVLFIGKSGTVHWQTRHCSLADQVPFNGKSGTDFSGRTEAGSSPQRGVVSLRLPLPWPLPLLLPQPYPVIWSFPLAPVLHCAVLCCAVLRCPVLPCGPGSVDDDEPAAPSTQAAGEEMTSRPQCVSHVSL